MKIIFSCLLLFIGFHFTQAQSNNPKYRMIRTMESMRQLHKEFPDYRKEQFKNQQFSDKKNANESIEEITLPLIFHILYSSDSEKISLAQIQSQIKVLNENFNNETIADVKNDPNQTKVANINISFCLAQIDQFESEGNKRSAIQYVSSTKKDWKYDNAIKSKNLGGTPPIDPEKYINIWVAHLNDDVSGYAQLPGGPEVFDGIVIDYRFFGTIGTATAPFNGGKTLTHLMGNYLNLYPLWGAFKCSDDYVSDTPIHNARNFGCPKGRHISTCNDNQEEMVGNFMDNTDDDCMYFFTHGQKSRMLATLSKGGARVGLLTTEVICSEEINSAQEISKKINVTDSQELTGSQLTIFPNPTAENTIIEISLASVVPDICQLEIFDSQGKLKWISAIDGNLNHQRISVNCKQWTEGTYVVKFSSEAFVCTDKLILIRQ